MKVLIEGHRYVLNNFENKFGEQVLQFIHKVPNNDGNGGLDLRDDGTTNEEVLEVLIDRMKYLQNKFPCRENELVIMNLEESLEFLKQRTAKRIARNVEGKHLV